MSVKNRGIILLTVAYHSEKALLALAADLRRQTIQPQKWLVVNNSPQSSCVLDLQAYCPVNLIEGLEGDGFGQGCNRGLDHLEAEGWEGWVWLLNPDTELLANNTIELLSRELISTPLNALIGTAVIDLNGNLEKSAGWIDPGLDFRRRRVDQSMMKMNGPKFIKVDWISGCNMIFSPASHPTKPRFDSSLPLYYEDMDLCIRVSHYGVDILWTPFIQIGHRRGQGSDTSLARRFRLSTCSYIRFLQRHRPGLVLILRSLRLFCNALIKFPLSPGISIAILRGLFDASRRPLV